MTYEFQRRAFEEAYAASIIGNGFFEHPSYYHLYKDRYYKTLKYIAHAMGGRPFERLMEVGGGQISLLCKSLYGTRCVVYDASRDYAAAIEKHGVGFGVCDISRDNILSEVQRDSFDIIVLCEVVEHILQPLHMTLAPFVEALRPGGALFLTTPNFNRLRNCVRIVTGRRITCNWFYPQRGQTLGHVLEFEHSHLRWQLEQCRLEDVHVEYAQLSNAGATKTAHILRKIVSPLMLRRRWRDNLVAYGYRGATAATRNSEIG